MNPFDPPEPDATDSSDPSVDPAETDSIQGFDLFAALAPPAWFGFHRMHRRAARTLAVLLVATVAAEVAVTFVVRGAGMQEVFLWYLGQRQPNTVWLVLIGWAIWCGFGARRWRASDSAKPGASNPVFGLAWALVAGGAWVATLVALTFAYVLLAAL